MQYVKFVGTLVTGIILMGEVEIFPTCSELQCDGRAGVSSSLAEGRRTKCPFCTKNLGYQVINAPSSVISGSFDAVLEVMEPKGELNACCNFSGFTVLGEILGRTPLEIKEMRITDEIICNAVEKLERSKFMIVGWVWVKRYSLEDMAESGTYDLMVNESRQGVVHVRD